jgi:hypothetical protein
VDERTGIRLVGLLCFFDEPVPALGQCLAGMRYLGVDHVVAVDGRYDFYPGDEFVSAEEQVAAIVMGCRSLGMGCTLHSPQGPWGGNEVQKRSHLFMLGLAECDPGDWMVVVDADEVYVRSPGGGELKARLEAAEEDVARITVRDMNAAAKNEMEQSKAHPEFFGLRKLYRAQPIVCSTNHHTYVTLDGRRLWTAAGEEHEPEPSLDLRELVEMHHRPGVRDVRRNTAKQVAYETREETRAERGQCRWVDRKLGERCPEQAARRVHCNPQRNFVKNQLLNIGADVLEMCERHAERSEQLARARLRRWGIDPKSVRWVDRMDPDDQTDKLESDDSVSAADVARHVFMEAGA